MTRTWDELPVDDVGYIHPGEILRLTDDELREWVAGFERRRYAGWRNHDNLWRSTLGLDTTSGKHIIDYGCGFGIEALQFARNGNRLTLFDLTDAGLEAAARVLAVHGYECDTTRGALPDADIFYANGVLHHTPDGPRILAEAPALEARLMLYSDRAPVVKAGAPFWRQMDEVGGYADSYSPETLAAAAPDWTVRETHYITPDGIYLTAVLTR